VFTDRIYNRTIEKETHLSEFSELLLILTWNLLHTPGKPRYCNSWDTVEALACPDKTTFFPENSMRLLNGFWFQIGSDFGLRIGFSFTLEVNEVDKSPFPYSLKTAHLTVRCL